MLRSFINSEVLIAAWHAAEQPRWPGRQSYGDDTASSRASATRDWLDSVQTGRTIRPQHRRCLEADLKWVNEVSRTKSEFRRLAAEAQQDAEGYAADEAWGAAAAGDEANEDDEWVSSEDMQRAIELSLQFDSDLQLAIRLSLGLLEQEEDADYAAA